MSDTNLVLKDLATGGALINVPGTMGSDGVIAFGLASRVPAGNRATLVLFSVGGGSPVNVPVTIEDDGRVILGSALDTSHNTVLMNVQYNGKAIQREVVVSSAGALTIASATFENPAVAPTYDGGEIGNVGTTTVAIRFSIPVVSADFKAGVVIKKNTVSQTISTATLQGDGVTVRYVITPAADANDTVTWEYAAASGDIASELDGTVLANVTAQNVTNNIAAVLPTFVSAEVGTVNDTTVAATFSVNLDATGSDYETGFTINVAGAPVAIGTATRQANKAIIYFTVPAVTNGQVVTIEYARPSGVVFNEADGGFMATFAAQAVTNNVV